MEAKLVIDKLRQEGSLQEARRLGEEAIAYDPHNDGALEALVNVYLDIEAQCINTGVVGPLREISRRLDTLIGSMTVGVDKARRRHERLKLAALPDYPALNSCDQLSVRGGHELEALEKARPLFASGMLHPRLNELYATIVFRWARAAMTDASSRPVRAALFEYLGVPFPKPARVNSLVLRLAIRVARKFPDFNFTKFFDMWNPRTLSNDDIIDPDGKYSLAAAAFEIVIDSDRAYEFPALLERVKASPHRRMAIIREAFDALISRNIKAGDRGRAIDLLELYVSHSSLHASSGRHSRLLSLAIRVMDGDELWRFVRFLVNWDTKLFRKADYEPTVGRDGKPVKSLVARALSRCFTALKADVGRHEHILGQVLDAFDEAMARSPQPLDELSVRRRAMIMSWMEQDNEAVARMSAMAVTGHCSPSFWLDFADMVPSRQLKMGLLAMGILQQTDCKTPADAEDMARLRLSMAQLMHAEGNDSGAATELNLCREVAEPMARYGAIKSTLSSDAVPDYNNELEYHRLAAEALALVYRDVKSEMFTVIRRDDRTVYLGSPGSTPLLVDSVLWPLLGRLQPGDGVEIKRDGKVVVMARHVTGEPFQYLATRYAVVIDGERLQCAGRPEPIPCDIDLPPAGTAVVVREYLDVEFNSRAAVVAEAPRGEVLERFDSVIAAVAGDGTATAGPDGPDFEIDGIHAYGDLLQVYYYKDSRGRAVAIETTPVPAEVECDAIKEISGKLSIDSDGTAMVRDVEITGTDAASMERDTYVTVRAVYNPTRRVWQSLSVTPYT